MPLPLLLFYLCLSSEFNFVFSKRRLKCRQSYQRRCKQWGTWLKHPSSIANADEPFTSLNCVFSSIFFCPNTRKHTRHKNVSAPPTAFFLAFMLHRTPAYSTIIHPWDLFSQLYCFSSLCCCASFSLKKPGSKNKQKAVFFFRHRLDAIVLLKWRLRCCVFPCSRTWRTTWRTRTVWSVSGRPCALTRPSRAHATWDWASRTSRGTARMLSSHVSALLHDNTPTRCTRARSQGQKQFKVCFFWANQGHNQVFFNITLDCCKSTFNRCGVLIRKPSTSCLPAFTYTANIIEVGNAINNTLKWMLEILWKGGK